MRLCSEFLWCAVWNWGLESPCRSSSFRSRAHIAEGSEFRVQGLGFRVLVQRSGLTFRDEGSEFRVLRSPKP